MKKIIAAFLTLFLLCSMVAGCASGQAPGQATEPSSAPPESPAAAEASEAASSDAPSEPVVLNLLSTALVEQPDGEIEQKMMDDYVALNPHVSFEAAGCSSTDLVPKLTAMITANDAPDVFTLFVQHITAMHEMGAIEPLNDLMGREYLDDIADAVRGEVFLGDTLYVVPWGCVPNCMVYRADVLEEAGIAPPKTFDELTEIAKQLTVDKDGDGVPDQYGLAPVCSNNTSAAARFIPFLRNCGVDEIYVENGKLTTNINSEGGIKALEYIYTWANVDKVIPPGAGEMDHAAVINLLATEVALITFSGPHTIGAVVAQNPSLEGKFRGAPMPTLKAGENSVNTSNMNGYCISSTSEHKEVVADYLAFLTNVENFLYYNSLTNRVPPLKSQAAVVGERNEITKGFIEAMQYAYHIELTPYDAKVRAVISEALNTMAAGAMSDPAEMARIADEKIKEILSEPT